MSGNNFPKLHNAMWPGLVGKGPDSEPPISLDTMLELTAAAQVDGVKFDGVDLFLADPHTSIDSSDDDAQAPRRQDRWTRVSQSARWSRRSGRRSEAARRWAPTKNASASSRRSKRPAASAGQLRDTGVRESGVVRIDSACGVDEWAVDPEGNQKKVAETFKQACDIAEGYGERLAAEGEICWGGMHSWKHMVELLEMVGRPRTLGFQADMAHTLLYTHGLQRPRASHPSRRLRLEGPQRGRRGAEDGDRTRFAPGPSISTSRRTTRRSKAAARTTRPGAIAWPGTRTANSISPTTPATGCATTRARSLEFAGTSAGTAACSRTRR